MNHAHSQAHSHEEVTGGGGAESSEPLKSRKPTKKGHPFFTVGSSVEVLTEDKGCGCVFFSATVIKEPPFFKKSSKRNSKNKLYVEYHDLLFQNEPLREYVDLSSVRPQPPASQEKVDGYFEEGEVVDAFYNDGWWTGVVTRLVEGEGGASRRVSVTFHHPFNVREFGASDLRPHLRWIDGTWVTPEKQNISVHSSDDGVVALENSENMVPSLMTDRPEESAPVNQNTLDVDEENSATERQHSPEPQASSLPLNKGDVSGARRQDESDRTIKEVLSDLWTEFRSSDSLPWEIRRKCRSIVAAQTVPPEINSVVENSGDMMQPVNSEVVVEGENCSADDVLNKLVIDESNHPVTGSSIEIDNFLCGRDDSTTQEKKGGRSLETDSVRADDVQSPMNGNSQNGDVNPMSSDKDSASHCVPEIVVIVIEDDDISPKQEVMEFDGDEFTNDVSGAGNKRGRDIDRSRAESFDRDAILATFERRKLQKMSPQVHGLNLQPSASAIEAPFWPCDGVVLPFEKENNLWKTIEAMETFQRMQQNPHFRPLEKFAKRSREGLAIGLMVTCSSVMEEALNLRVTDPKSVTDSILETLTELETHGFDVRAVKDRVNDFIAMKDKQRDNLQEVKRLRYQISEREGEKRRNREQVDMIKKQIQRLQERLALIAAADAKVDEEIACLQGRVRETKGKMNSARLDFESSPPW